MCWKYKFSLNTLFSEMHVITCAHAGTHASKFTHAINRMCKIIVFSLSVLLLLYISCKKKFFFEDYVQEIQKIVNCKILRKICCSLVSSNKPLLKSLLDTDILLCFHFQEQCICSKPTWISWLIHQLLMLHSTT